LVASWPPGWSKLTPHSKLSLEFSAKILAENVGRGCGNLTSNVVDAEQAGYSRKLPLAGKISDAQAELGSGQVPSFREVRDTEAYVVNFSVIGFLGARKKWGRGKDFCRHFPQRCFCG